MPSINQQRAHIQDIGTAQFITGALRDISAIEMREYRAQFETNGRFYEELRSLYSLIQQIARREGKGMAAKRNHADRLYVAYTTNKHFYGTLNVDVMRAFTKHTSAKDRCLIIGDTGKLLWRTGAKKRLEVQHLSFKDDMPDESETKAFLAQVSPYRQVFVFYPSFVSAFSQEAQMLDITFTGAQSEGRAQAEETPQYILEPEILEMFDFFDTQVRYVLFKRLLLETQLSRVAARLLKMDMADQNAQSMLVVERRELRHLQSSFASTRMLETLSGYLQWHKKN